MFFGRRMHTGDYDPISAHAAIAYWLAETSSDFTFGTGTDINIWHDRSPFANNIAQLTDAFPDYEATGWNGATPAVDFTGEHFVGATGASLNTAMAGSRIPFSIFARVKFDVTGQQSLCAWVREDAGQSRSVLGISSSGKLQYTRQPNAGVPEQVSTADSVGTGRVTIGVSFDASGFATLFLNGVQKETSSAFSSSDMDGNVFKVGTGPLLPSDGVDGQAKAILVSGRATTVTEHAKFHRAMVTAYG